MKEKFAWFKEFMWDYTKIEPHFYYDYNDPTIIVMIACWPSAESHFQELHKSEEFLEIIGEFGGYLDVRSNYHADIGEEPYKAATKGDVLVWTRIWVADEDEPEFSKHATFLSPDRPEDGVTAPCASGWRITDGGWTELDAFDYYEKHGGAQSGPSAPNGITEEELLKLNEMVQIVGLDSVNQDDPFANDPSAPFNNAKLIKFKQTRKFAKLDLRYDGEDKGEDEGEEDD